jgi:transposase
MGSSDFGTLTELLDLDGFEVIDVASERSSKLRRLTVTPIVIAGLCPHCGQSTDERHACHDREVADLPLGGWKTQLVVRLFQFRCGRCDKFFTPPHPGLAHVGCTRPSVFWNAWLSMPATGTSAARRGSPGSLRRPPNAGITITWSGSRKNLAWSCCRSGRWGLTSCR